MSINISKEDFNNDDDTCGISQKSSTNTGVAQSIPKVEKRPPLKIHLTSAPKVGFASQQNSVALIKELSIENTSEKTWGNLRLSITSNPLVIEEKSWEIDQIASGTTINISDRLVKLDADLLLGLNEQVNADLILEITVESGDLKGERESLSKKTTNLETLPKNHWGGIGSMVELLPAFCMPNDPACDKILKSACKVLKRAGKDSALKGYENNSRTRTWELSSAIWSAVASMRLDYSLPPASFEEQGQKIRSASDISEIGLATCLDTTMLFASLFEQAHLNPIIVLTEGHAFVGVWLQPQEFNQLVIEDAMALRKRVELQDILVFETTMITGDPPSSFSDAINKGKSQLEEDDKFIMAIDVKRARMRQILPLSLTEGKVSDRDTETKPSPIEALEEAPLLPAFDVEIKTSGDSELDRVEQWQRKLLDLTARNRLLNLPPTSKHVPLLCSNIGKFEDLLSDGKVFRIATLPDLEQGGRDSELYNQSTNNDLVDAFTNEALDNKQIYSNLTERKLDTNLIELYRKSRSDIAEGGANTLFLALGFLHWKKSAEDTRVYRAPLLLVPVTLKRKSARSGITLSAHQDETRFNMTLLELLKQDFDLHIPGLDEELPEDDYGVDVIGIWNHIRQQIKDISGFEVKEDCALATFSFSKYLMWKDLVDRRDELMVNPVVKQLLQKGEQSYQGEYRFPDPQELDKVVEPSELFTPLPADSSQIAAIVASTCHCNFVLDGPPGTGKSQTIANMIVHNLARGKRVLFVAEKMAALEVVHRRLQEKGLGQFCLEAHSNKTSKSSILSQLDNAWSSRGDLTVEQWEEETNQLKKLRDTLNNVCELLHKRHKNGLTVHFAMGHVIKHYDTATARLNWTNKIHSLDEFEQLKDTVKKLSLHAEALKDSPKGFELMAYREWSNAWQEKVVRSAQNIPFNISELTIKTSELYKQCGFETNSETLLDLSNMITLSKALLKTFGYDLAFAFTPSGTQAEEAAIKLNELLTSYNKSKSSLSVSYSDKTIKQIKIDSFSKRWASAQGKFILFKALESRKIKKEYALVIGTSEQPDLEKDAPKIVKLQSLLGEIDSVSDELKNVPGFSGLKSDTSEILKVIDVAKTLMSAITACASGPESLQAIKSSFKRLVLDTNELLANGGGLHSAIESLESAHKKVSKDIIQLEELTATSDLNRTQFTSINTLCKAVKDNEPLLRRWCGWKKVRAEAINQNLAPLVDGLEDQTITSQSLEKQFLTGYCKWFAAQQIDKTPTLRNFSSSEHTNTILEFRSIDEKVAKLTIEYTKAVLTARLPARSKVGKKDGYGILKHELQKKRMHKPLRQLATEMGDAFTNLAPCMLMSPLSIAQYLPANQQLFDLVIFDEASQITPWDAVGSIARGKQVVIAGDPRQMPPTNFFQRGATQSEFDGDTEADLESILDECLAVGIPKHSLSWHYRSRHESLIAFSNYRYYDSNLITFPAAVTVDSAVSWQQVDGIYSKGRDRNNQNEAKAIVEKAIELLKRNESLNQNMTLGIITLNTEQQKLIEDLLDKTRRDHPEIEQYFSDDLTEPVVVKNLETVQGDERDIILLGIGYGPTEPGANTMSMNFGPLNRDGGERRLNVAISRARQEMIVFSSFSPSMIDLNRTGARAVRDLKHFIEFAEKGPQSLGAAIQGSVGGYDSPFEESVASRLRDKGWEVVPQIGVSRFRIDLGIVHPDHPGDYLAGVECDGASYHSSATARDRDKVRALVLEGLGWSLVRVWSTDWFIDPNGEIERLHSALQVLHEKSKVAEVENFPLTEQNETDESSQPLEQESVDLEELPANDIGVSESVDTSTKATLRDCSKLIASNTSGQVEPPVNAEITAYTEVDFSSHLERINADLFYSDEYTDTLALIVEHTLEAEAPIEEDLLVKRIARAHDFARSGKRIKDRVLAIVDQHHFTEMDVLGGNFIWKNDEDPQSYTKFRKGNSGRKIDEIPYLEIAALLSLDEAEITVDFITKHLGIKRTTAAIRDRLESAIIHFTQAK